VNAITRLSTNHSPARRRALVILCLIAAALGSVHPATAQGPDATITVTTVQDELNTSPPCSLREAIQAANQNVAVGGCAAGSGNDLIILPAGVYRLTLAGADDANAVGDLDVFPAIEGEALAIQGAGAASTVVDGNAIDRVFHLGRFGDLRLAGLTVQNGRLGEAAGAGILAWGGLRLENVVVRNNTVTGVTDVAGGGGLCVGCGPGAGQATLVNTVVANNTARRGGGIFTNRPTEISASTITGNTSTTLGAGIINYGQLTLTNSTISGNTAASAAAISHEGGSLTLLNNTLTQNTVTGSSSQAALLIWASATIRNTIVAANLGKNCQLLVPLTSLGNNLSSDTSCAAAFIASGDRNNTAPLLGTLRNNGGPTPTHALLWGSPAIDGGSNAGCPAADQRGVARPQRAACDIGAVEFNDRLLFAPLLLRSTP
jgi:CSLREA domain-containing protein